jgi:hypothetical protein
MQHDLGQHQAAAIEAVNAAFEAGRLQGIAEERTRVKALIDADLSSTASPRFHRDTAPKSYGNVITLVRPALREIGEAIDARGLAELIGGDITEKQTRNALRQMIKTGEAVRAERGKYLWRGASESPSSEKSGDESPDPFDLAAE